MRIGLIIRRVFEDEFAASCPDLAEVHAEGRDLNEVHHRAREAVLDALTAREERRVKTPYRRGLLELAAIALEVEDLVGVLFVEP